MQNKLIFDLGFHKGEDTINYLIKGYDVVAVEANHTLYLSGIKSFDKYIKEGKLILLNKAIYDIPDIEIEFYINENKSEWGSIKQIIAEQDASSSIKQKIKTTTFSELCSTYGVPYYCKVDIESADIFVAKDLDYFFPKYISFELNQNDYLYIFSQLQNNGYTKFQLINQANNLYGSSGEFAEYLDNKWLSLKDILNRYIKFIELRNMDRENLSFGWLDVHAYRED